LTSIPSHFFANFWIVTPLFNPSPFSYGPWSFQMHVFFQEVCKSRSGLSFVVCDTTLFPLSCEVSEPVLFSVWLFSIGQKYSPHHFSSLYPWPVFSSAPLQRDLRGSFFPLKGSSLFLLLLLFPPRPSIHFFYYLVREERGALPFCPVTSVIGWGLFPTSYFPFRATYPLLSVNLQLGDRASVVLLLH